MPEHLRAPRGTTDILSPQTFKWSYVEGVMRCIADTYGFEEIRTPVFEQTELFSRGVGEGTDIVTKQMYSFTDKGGRNLTLRPEFTAPTVRVYFEHQLTHLPLVKWFYLGPGFRYERPQSGRFRQFHQFGVEAIGSMNPVLDAEVIGLAIEVFNQLELKNLEVRLNSIGCASCRGAYREALRNYFLAHQEALCEDCRTVRLQKNPLRVLDCKVPSCLPLIEKAPVSTSYLCSNCADHFEKVQHWLQLIQVPYTLDRHLVRGLDYYTKTVFEVISSSLGSQNSLCGGGRYDDLVESLGGPSRPAVGFATGIERIILTMEKQESAFPSRDIDLFAISLGEKAEETLFPMILRFRQKGLKVRRDYQERSLTAQLKEADRQNARWAIILGDDELAKGEAVVRNMQTHNQETCPLAGLEPCVINKILSETKAVALPVGEKQR